MIHDLMEFYPILSYFTNRVPPGHTGKIPNESYYSFGIFLLCVFGVFLA